MRSIRALCFLALTLTLDCAATHAQVEPLITGAVSLVTDNSSSAYVRCQSYDNGVCSRTSTPFASCANGSIPFALSAQYCTVWLPSSPTCCGFSGFCYSCLCLGGFDPEGNLELGFKALQSNTVGENNIAIGFKTLASAGIGSPQDNVAIGNYSLSGVLRGTDNIAIGYSSGGNLVNGSNNIYLEQAAKLDMLSTQLRELLKSD